MDVADLASVVTCTSFNKQRCWMNSKSLPKTRVFLFSKGDTSAAFFNWKVSLQNQYYDCWPCNQVAVESCLPATLSLPLHPVGQISPCIVFNKNFSVHTAIISVSEKFL